ncbi:MAG: ParB N-terminal domain-containing protein [Methylocella sp.]
MKYELHDLANLFPPMTDAEFSSLVDDVKKHGVREPITLFGGKVIEGRHRMKAAEEAGVELPFKNFDGNDAAALDYVASANFERRHLDPSQRAMVAAKIANMRQGERTDLEPSENLHKVSQDEAAHKAKVSTRSILASKIIEALGELGGDDDFLDGILTEAFDAAS